MTNLPPADDATNSVTVDAANDTANDAYIISETPPHNAGEDDTADEYRVSAMILQTVTSAAKDCADDTDKSPSVVDSDTSKLAKAAHRVSKAGQGVAFRNTPESSLIAPVAALAATAIGIIQKDNASTVYGDTAAAIVKERRRQIAKYHNPNDTITWVAVAAEETLEAIIAADAAPPQTDELHEELVQVAAVCVAWLEDLMPPQRA